MDPTCKKVKVLHVITRFDKGGSAENAFLTVCGLGERYDVVLVAGEGAFPGVTATNRTREGTPLSSAGIHGRSAEGWMGEGQQTGAPNAEAAESDPDAPGEANDKTGSEADAIRANVSALLSHRVSLIGLRHLVRDLRPASDLLAFFALIRILRREKPHIVHTHTSKAGILGRWAARLCHVHVIVHTPHGHIFWGYFSPRNTKLFILLERWTARITDAIVTLTLQEKQDHLQVGIAPERRFKVIHSGVDLRLFRPERFAGKEEAVRRSLGIPPGLTVVGTAGRLTPIKGQETLLRAVAGLLRRGEKIRLLLLGEGEQHRDLETLADGLGIAEGVHFLGWRPDVARVMACLDIFCFPSLNEGMGKVLVEAMAMHKPIIASDVGGIRDLVRSGENGILVPPGDVAAWTGAIASLCQDPEMRRRLGAEGGRRAPLFSAERMIEEIERLYDVLLNPKKRTP